MRSLDPQPVFRPFYRRLMITDNDRHNAFYADTSLVLDWQLFTLTRKIPGARTVKNFHPLAVYLQFLRQELVRGGDPAEIATSREFLSEMR